jgi:hypothetical protein
MSRIRIVKGKIIEITHGEYNIYSASDITYSARQIIQTGKEGGVVYGKPEIWMQKETCVLSPNAVAVGDSSYYIRRFTGFMKRHPDCGHIPPVYYYGTLREIGKMLKEDEIVIQLSSIPIPGQLSAKEKIKRIEAELLEADQASPYKYEKNGKMMVPVPKKSYGYKYCERFTSELRPNLTPGGQKWLDEARADLQKYMEQGVVDKNYISTHNKNYNINNGFVRIDKNDKEILQPKSIIEKFYTNIELNNTRFQSFAFASHPDAYNPKEMSKLPAHDLICILFTPDIKEFLGPETWEQAWVTAKNLNYKEIAGSTWEKIKKDTREAVKKGKDKLKEYWDEIFD